MLSDERIRQIADDIYCSEGTRAEIEHSIRAALAEQAETHALELRAYEATVANLEQRIKDLQLELLVRDGEAQRVLTRCPLCEYQYGHRIGCDNNPVDIALRAAAPLPQKEPRHD